MKKTLTLALGLFVFMNAIANPSFDQMKTLIGTWKTTEGDSKVTYELKSGGSVIEETFGDMVTVFHADNDRLLATHYCSMGNQPRMATENNPDLAKKILKFNFLDISNFLPSQNDYISDLMIEFLSPTQVKETWTFTQRDGKKGQEVFELQKL